jgi:hypothetical protein
MRTRSSRLTWSEFKDADDNWVVRPTVRDLLAEIGVATIDDAILAVRRMQRERQQPAVSAAMLSGKA